MCIPAYLRSAKAPVETRRLSRVHSLTWKPIHPFVRSLNDLDRSLDHRSVATARVNGTSSFQVKYFPSSLSLLFQQAAAVSRNRTLDARRSTLIETNKYRCRDPRSPLPLPLESSVTVYALAEHGEPLDTNVSRDGAARNTDYL